MKHNATILTTIFSLLCASNMMYGMEKDNKPNIYCEEDIAIVLHFAPKKYNHGNTSSQQSYHSKPYDTHLLHNPINPNTKINSISFNDQTKDIQKIFEQASQKKDECTQKKINYALSVYFLASHNHHVARGPYNLALPTTNYIFKAKETIRHFYSKFIYDPSESINDTNPGTMNLYSVFYNPSRNDSIQEKDNNIQLITEKNKTEIKIAHNATVNLDFYRLSFETHDVTINRNFSPGKLMDSELITTKDGNLIMNIQGCSESIILIGV